MSCYLGVDAGNSKTVALVCSASGAVLGHGWSGNGDIYGAASPAAAVQAVESAVAEALASAGVSASDVAGAAYRLAGVDWPEDEAFWAERLPDPGRRSIANDGFAAIRCGELSGTGLAVVVGTGPALAARGPSGVEWSASFWIQDSLGAGGLGNDGLRAVFHAAAGIGAATALTEEVLAFYGRSDVETLLHELTAREAPASLRNRARLAPVVTKAAAAGDPVASSIVTGMASRLADYALLTAGRVGYVATDAVPVVLAGSVVSASPCMADALTSALPSRLPHAKPHVATLPPVAGAALDALAESGVALTDDTVTTLRATLPPHRPIE